MRGQHVLALLAGLLRQVLLEQHVDRGDRRRAADRVAAERRRVRNGFSMYFSHVLRRPDARADRHDAAAETLAERHQVRHDAVVLAAEHLAAAPHPALDLVEDEHRAVLVADLARRREVTRRRDVDAALALDRLDHDGGHAVAREVAARHHHPQRVNVAERDVRPALQRQERFAEHGLGRPAEGARATCRGTPRSCRRSGDVPSSGSPSSDKPRSTRSRVREERVLEISRRDHRAEVREIRPQRIDQLLRVDRLLVELLPDGLQDLRVPVPGQT